ncbi:huntingtin-interacting protein 1, partial [Plakobranchus ocellatus]
ESQLEVNRMVEEKQMVQDNLQKSADDVSQQLAEVSSFNTKLEKQKEVAGLDDFYDGWIKSQDLESRLHSLEETQTQLEADLATKSSELTDLSSQLREARDAAAEKEAELAEARDKVQRELDQSRAEKANSEAKLEAQLAEAREKLAETEASRDCLEVDLNEKITALTQKCAELEQDKTGLADRLENWMKRMLGQTIEESIKMIQDAVEQGDNPAHSSSTCTAEYLLLRANSVLECLSKAKELGDLSTAEINSLESTVSLVTGFSYHLSECVVQGFATSHAAQIEPGEDLANECRAAGKAGITWLQNLKEGKSSAADVEEVEASIQRLIHLGDGLLPKMEDVKAEEIGDLLENEMAGMTEAIEAAAAKIQDMLNKTRQDNTGVDLEVNENILGSCTDLMKAIKVLVEKSRDLQREIVVQGRGTTSVADFYKKNHRWTEGLLSAAKAVGWGATTLLDTADRVVSGQGKFEEIMACAHEIAASTAQLVVSSKVKAERGSRLLAELGAASKDVNQATGNVVASAKAAGQIVEDQNLMDFSSMSLHQTKKMEMQCQIRVMELECNLEKERKKLGELRKQHYTLAGEAEGWEVNQDGEMVRADDTIPAEEDSVEGADLCTQGAFLQGGGSATIQDLQVRGGCMAMWFPEQEESPVSWISRAALV